MPRPLPVVDRLDATSVRPEGPASGSPQAPWVRVGSGVAGRTRVGRANRIDDLMEHHDVLVSRDVSVVGFDDLDSSAALQ
jgi:hypothetical protein